MKQSLNDLIQDLKKRRFALVDDLPPILLLGAGASIESGIGAMGSLIKHFGCKNNEKFYDHVRKLTNDERYRHLAEFLTTQEPSKVTDGYQALAALSAAKYFDVILSTNFDPLLDDALASVRLWRKDYLLLINGVMRSDWLNLLMNSRSPRLKVIKLHGDLFHRCMAWTPEEMEDFIKDIIPHLKSALDKRDILVVGHSLNDSPHIRDLLLESSGTIWYTHPTMVPDFVTSSAKIKVIVGPECKFELLFTNLATNLGVEIPSGIVPTKFTPSTKMIGVSNVAQTMDDLMASIVAVSTPDGNPFCTGFVLAQPSVIVTDGYSMQRIINQDRVIIIAYGDHRFESKVIWNNQSHPFGPVTLQVPKELKVPGLSANTGPVKHNLLVHIGVAVHRVVAPKFLMHKDVAAGLRIGVSSGLIKNPKEERLEIAPIGNVDHLVAIDCVIAPGSSGAPVVDNSFTVRGFIVAGSDDHPPSYMYPAYRWIDILNQKTRRNKDKKNSKSRET